jgi:hypothetical protein
VKLGEEMGFMNLRSGDEEELSESKKEQPGRRRRAWREWGPRS